MTDRENRKYREDKKEKQRKRMERKDKKAAKEQERGLSIFLQEIHTGRNSRSECQSWSMGNKTADQAKANIRVCIE